MFHNDFRLHVMRDGKLLDQLAVTNVVSDFVATRNLLELVESSIAAQPDDQVVIEERIIIHGSNSSDATAVFLRIADLYVLPRKP